MPFYKYLIVSAIVFALPTSVFSQSGGFFQDDDKFFYGGLSIGANFCQVDGDTYGGYHKLGLNTGPIVYARLSKSLLASLELLYTQKGSRGVAQYESYYAGTAFKKYYLDLNYFEAQAVVHYLINDKWSIGIGGSYGRLVKSKEEMIDVDQAIYINPDLHPFRKEDFCLMLAGSWQIGSGLFLTGRFQYSQQTMRDLDKVPVQTPSGRGQYNNVISLRLMYLIK
jgi:hypothetical protein